MNVSLPEIIQFQQRCAHETAWADHYGALYVAAAYCGIDLPTTPFCHVWQHGCIAPWSNDPMHIVYSTPNPEKKRLFVARNDQERILKEQGWFGAKAIGLPVVYLPDPKVHRTPRTLLIMPQHTLLNTRMGSEEERREYVNSLKPHISRFDVVAACVSPSCVANGYYVSDFRALGIEIIPGALTSDLNAYLRMRCLMEQFETMTTNSWGSHLAYALYFGMKVSVFGDSFSIPKEDLLKDISWAAYPETRLNQRQKEGASGWTVFSNIFRAEPQKAISARDLGRWLVGEEYKVSPEEMRALFDWS